MIALLTATCIALGVAMPASYVVTEPPMIPLPCMEDEVPIIMNWQYEPKPSDRGFWDGERYYRLCVNNEDILEGGILRSAP